MPLYISYGFCNYETNAWQRLVFKRKEKSTTEEDVSKCFCVYAEKSCFGWGVCARMKKSCFVAEVCAYGCRDVPLVLYQELVFLFFLSLAGNCQIKKMSKSCKVVLSQWTGFEPVRAEPNWFLADCLKQLGHHCVYNWLSDNCYSSALKFWARRAGWIILLD